MNDGVLGSYDYSVSSRARGLLARGAPRLLLGSGGREQGLGGRGRSCNGGHLPRRSGHYACCNHRGAARRSAAAAAETQRRDLCLTDSGGLMLVCVCTHGLGDLANEDQEKGALEKAGPGGGGRHQRLVDGLQSEEGTVMWARARKRRRLSHRYDLLSVAMALYACFCRGKSPYLAGGSPMGGRRGNAHHPASARDCKPRGQSPKSHGWAPANTHPIDEGRCNRIHRSVDSMDPGYGFEDVSLWFVTAGEILLENHQLTNEAV